MTSKQTPKARQANARVQSAKAKGKTFVPLLYKIQIEGYVENGGVQRPANPHVVAIAAVDFTEEWLRDQVAAIKVADKAPDA
ncbi:hypothetical protein C5E10_18000 [Pseudoclavibacter sp. RFBG4]|uniref:hypothetical protein n=1 Tax=Pseudoclavibacter sp. RFBG4 TaxID=2080575 RepID=UPI000CE9385E|nr:hypothetical protein [Pseudoclavibacter sp. RFBG4]PPG25963.1 hypothetical protein C5E10_18000 [Pseudoclavibacter sp. RFBG4]